MALRPAWPQDIHSVDLEGRQARTLSMDDGRNANVGWSVTANMVENTKVGPFNDLCAFHSGPPLVGMVCLLHVLPLLYATSAPTFATAEQ